MLKLADESVEMKAVTWVETLVGVKVGLSVGMKAVTMAWRWVA